MLACLSPADSNFDDNLSTLQSACVITHCTAGLREQPHKLQRCANSFLGLNSFARVACQYAVIPSSSVPESANYRLTELQKRCLANELEMK